jgi:bacterioferritin-associated ferredoxin
VAKSHDDIVCFCNNVLTSTVQAAIEKGASNLSEIFDKTGAGTGPCGGTCRDSLLLMLKSFYKGPGDKSQASEAPEWVPSLSLVEAISLFNRRYYWETHEVLERLWLEETGEIKAFYQGLIQASAALYHVLNANPRGVIRLAEEAARKLAPYMPAYETIPLGNLVASLASLGAQAKEILGGTRSGFDYDMLPVLRVGDHMGKAEPGPK